MMKNRKKKHIRRKRVSPQIQNLMTHHLAQMNPSDKIQTEFGITLNVTI